VSIKALIFDFGGVLVRTDDWSARYAWEDRLGLSRGELNNIVFNSQPARNATIGIGSETDVWNHVQKVLGLNTAELVELQKDFWSKDSLDERLVNFILESRPLFKTAILSNAWSNARTLFLEFGLDKIFDEIFISAEVGIKKPDQAIFDLVVRQLAVKPAEVIFVDDFSENIEAAKTVGMQAILFQSTGQVVSEITRIKQLNGSI